MILSGPKACRGSTKEARILPVFLISPGGRTFQSATSLIARQRAGGWRGGALTANGRGQRVVDSERHGVRDAGRLRVSLREEREAEDGGGVVLWRRIAMSG